MGQIQEQTVKLAISSGVTLVGKNGVGTKLLINSDLNLSRGKEKMNGKQDTNNDMREEGSSSSDSGDADDGGRLAVENARKTYAVDMARKLSSILQETSVAKFELDHLPAQRQVFLKKGSLLYLTPRTQARESLEAQEREVGDKLAGVQALLDSP